MSEKCLTVAETVVRQALDVTLTYDNIGLWCSNREIFNCLTAKIDQITKWCDVTMKTQDPIDYESLLLSNEHPEDSAPFIAPGAKGTSHLGIQYALRLENGMHRPTWRLDPERLSRYEPALDALDSDRVLTCREVGRIVGIVIWHLTVIQRPLCYATTLLTILSNLTAGKPTLKKSDWDLSALLPDLHRAYLSSMLMEVMRNSWHAAPPPRNSGARVYTLFTDSSKNCMGAVVVNPDGSTVPESVPFHPSIHNVHIYLKELTAQVWFTVKLVKSLGLSKCHIQMVTDNSAVFFGILHMYSSNRYANRWIQYLHQCLTEAGCTWSVFQVVSGDNPGDGPSRFESGVCEKRLSAGLKSVAAAIEGRMRSSADKNIFNYNADIVENPLRHIDIPDENELDELAASVVDFLPPLDFSAPSDNEMEQWFGLRKRQRSA